MAFGIKNSRLVHIIPKTVNSLIQKNLILAAKPPVGFLIEHIRKMHFARPDPRREKLPVLRPAEISFFHPFLVNAIALFHLNACVYNGNEMNAHFFHVFYQLPKIRKVFFINGKILIPLHIINIKIDTVQGNSVFPVQLRHFPHLIRCHITPAALSVAKGPLWRNIASPRQPAEFLHQFFRRLPFHQVKVQVFVRHRYRQFLHFAVSDIKNHFSRMIHKYTKILTFPLNDEEIVCPV